jgi:hypothetical protein
MLDKVPNSSSSRESSWAKQQQQLQQPLLLLALVAARDSTATPPAALAKAASRIAGSATLGSKLVAAAAAGCQQEQQQQQLELRPVLLQQPGLLVPGASVLSPAAGASETNAFLQPHLQQQQSLAPAVSAAALSGTLAAAVGPGGFVYVWDVLTGRSLLGSKAHRGCSSSSSRGAAFSAVELVELSSGKQQHGGAAGCVVLMGSSDGVLTFALV